MAHCREGDVCGLPGLLSSSLGRQALWGGSSHPLHGRVTVYLAPAVCSASASNAGDFRVLPHQSYPQVSALDALAGMMMKGAAKCDKHAEEQNFVIQ